MSVNLIKRDLQYIKSSVKDSSFKQKKAIIDLILADVIQDISEMEISFEVTYTGQNEKKHYETFAKRYKKYKAKLLVDMQELQHRLNRKTVNEAACIRMLDEMIATDLYVVYTNELINRFVPKHYRYEQETVTFC
ncbi:hypothetical protein [Priestia megaterium]|uniref:hypothetical protein n=1 Tax=Priestia megaterium TaxID=1404 RepID=UPI000BF58241|nr:hypothetical protein [Priestia megaterium]PFQ79729.1 hypothetical protein COK11_20925 [Priestia megaterium]